MDWIMEFGHKKCQVFLWKLWHIVTGDIRKPTKQKGEDDRKFWERLEDWDSKNHQILTWIHNTSIPSIKLQFARFEIAKDVWSLLGKRYSMKREGKQGQEFGKYASLILFQNMRISFIQED